MLELVACAVFQNVALQFHTTHDIHDLVVFIFLYNASSVYILSWCYLLEKKLF